MRKYLTGVLLFLLIAGPLSAQIESFAVQRALQRYTEAYGGTRDADALSSVSIEGAQTQGGGRCMIFSCAKKRPDSIRYRLSYGVNSIVAGYDGHTGWLQTLADTGVEIRELVGEELDAIEIEAVFEGPLFRHLQTRRSDIEMTGTERIDGVNAYVFEVLDSDGRKSRYYLDVRNPHVLKRELLANDGAVQLTTLYRDYREVDGFPFAFEVEMQVDGEVATLVKLESVAVNPGLLSFYFKMPK